MIEKIKIVNFNKFFSNTQNTKNIHSFFKSNAYCYVSITPFKFVQFNENYL